MKLDRKFNKKFLRQLNLSMKIRLLHIMRNKDSIAMNLKSVLNVIKKVIFLRIVLNCQAPFIVPNAIQKVIMPKIVKIKLMLLVFTAEKIILVISAHKYQKIKNIVIIVEKKIISKKIVLYLFRQKEFLKMIKNALIVGPTIIFKKIVT